MADPSDWQDVDDWQDATGEPGHPGANPHAPGQTEAQRAQSNTRRMGTVGDAAKTWANTAALGGGPQIAGVIGALAEAGSNPVDGHPLDAYRDVRDETAKELKSSAETTAGDIGGAVGMLSTPVPAKGLGRGAPVRAKATQAAKVGGVAGLVHGAATSKGDLTNMTTADLKRVLLDSLIGAGTGAAGGYVAGATLGAVEQPLRSTARKLPMDMLGVGEPARRSMQRQGIYDSAGDDLLALVRPFRSGMRKGSLTDDAIAELTKRGERLDDVIAAIDTKSSGKTVGPGSMAVSVLRGSKPFSAGSLQDKQVASRMGKEAESLIESLGESPVSLERSEQFKQRFSPGVAKELRHAGEPAAKTTALAEVYRALKTANEAGAANVSPELARDFIGAKESYSRLAAPLSGANVERAALRSSDFDLGDMLSAAPDQGSVVAKLTEGLPFAGLVKAPLDLAGRAYGRGTAANVAEFLANRAANNTGGVVGAAGGDKGKRLLQEYIDLLAEEEQSK